MANDVPASPDAQFEQMYQKYRGLIYSHLRKRLRENPADIEDLTEEVFARAYRSLKGRSDPVIAEKKWLIKIADNLCTKFIEQQQSYNQVHLRAYTTTDGEVRSPLDDIAAPSGEDQPEWITEQQDLIRVVNENIAQLSSDVQKALILHFIEGWTYEEIAVHSERSLSTVAKDARKGIDQLRVRLLHVEE
jgi:RNA polymerase sigma-70 factor (ECF subfamily)